MSHYIPSQHILYHLDMFLLLCYTICQIKNGFFLNICFCPVCDRAAIILSAKLIISSSYPPLLSSNLFSSSHPFSQPGSPWINIKRLTEEGSDREDLKERKRERESKTSDREGTMEKLRWGQRERVRVTKKEAE